MFLERETINHCYYFIQSSSSNQGECNKLGFISVLSYLRYKY